MSCTTITRLSFHKDYQKDEDFRQIFAKNLRYLINKEFNSIFSAAAVIGIQRTQLNRYLNAESFPATIPMLRILSYFKVDGRIFTDPLPELPQ